MRAVIEEIETGQFSLEDKRSILHAVDSWETVVSGSAYPGLKFKQMPN
jgi:hypothetical protein